MARSHESLVARFHALWTLEGLGALEAPLVREMLEDPNPRMRVQALRVSETLYKGGDKSFADSYRRAARDADADVAAHAVLTLERAQGSRRRRDDSGSRGLEPGGRRRARRQHDSERAAGIGRRR